jgi:hypothetical protein
MKLSQNKPFHAYLKKRGIVVKNGQVPIDKADKIPELYHKFGIEEAKKAGLPKQFQEHADKVINISLNDLERAGQKPEKYDVKIVESEKNYESGTWNGYFEGTVSNLWKWLMDECTENHNDADFVEAIESGLEDLEEA